MTSEITLATGLYFPNGLAFTPDGVELIVAETSTAKGCGAAGGTLPQLRGSLPKYGSPGFTVPPAPTEFS